MRYIFTLYYSEVVFYLSLSLPPYPAPFSSITLKLNGHKCIFFSFSIKEWTTE